MHLDDQQNRRNHQNQRLHTPPTVTELTTSKNINNKKKSPSTKSKDFQTQEVQSVSFFVDFFNSEHSPLYLKRLVSIISQKFKIQPI
ncbi:hypothetical protein BLOT_011215 [Blomia tropicalis]|nr:hypothetical protein BLOT_011215 [Blomia tropicalis]